MRRFKRGFALILALALICGAAAMAETLDEFINGSDGFNASIPDLVPESDNYEVDDMVDLLELSYDADFTEAMEQPVYSASGRFYCVMFDDEDDPMAGFSLFVASDDPDAVLGAFMIFGTYYFQKAGMASEVSSLLLWLQSGFKTQPMFSYGDYTGLYVTSDGNALVSFHRS